MVEASRTGSLAHVFDRFAFPSGSRSFAGDIAALDYSSSSRRLAFAIELLPTADAPPEFVGWCALDRIDWPDQRAVLEVALPDAKHRGQGYGTEAILLLLQLAFDRLALQKVSGRAAEFNTRALRCLKRVGFTTECCRREAHFYGGRYHDSVEMSLLEHEYRKLHGYEGLRLLGYTERQIAQLGSATR